MPREVARKKGHSFAMRQKKALNLHSIPKGSVGDRVPLHPPHYYCEDTWGVRKNFSSVSLSQNHISDFIFEVYVEVN